MSGGAAGSGGAHPQRAEERGATSVPSANSSSPTAKKQKLDKERTGKTGVAAVYCCARRYRKLPASEREPQLENRIERLQQLQTQLYELQEQGVVPKIVSISEQIWARHQERLKSEGGFGHKNKVTVHGPRVR